MDSSTEKTPKSKETPVKGRKLTPAAAIDEVCRLLCRGLQPANIFQRAKDEKWGLTHTVLTDVIESATARLTEAAAHLNLDTEVGKALTRLETLYKEALDANPKEIKAALSVQKEIISMLRLRERVRHNAAAAQNPAGSERPRKLRIV